MIQIYAKERGGFSAFGSAWFDARENAVVSQARVGESVTLAARFWANINDINFEVNSIDVTEPTIVDNQFTATLSNFRIGSSVRFDVMLENDDMRQLSVFMAGYPSAQPTGYSSDYGDFV